MTGIAKEVARALEIIPAQTIVKEDFYYTYQNCNKEGVETPVVKAPREKNIIPELRHGFSFVPTGAEAEPTGNRQTMSNWILKATEDYLTPVYAQLHKEQMKRKILHADETTLQVLHEPGKEPKSKSYMWLYRTSGDTNKPIVLHEYQPDRGAKIRKSSSLDSTDTCIWTVIADTTTSWRGSQQSAASHMPEESLTKHCNLCTK